MRLLVVAAIIIVLAAILYAENLETRTDCFREVPGLKYINDAQYIDVCLTYFVQQRRRAPKVIEDLIPYCPDFTPPAEAQNFRDQWNNPYRILFIEGTIQIVTSNAGGDEHRYSNYLLLEKKLKSLALK